MSAPPSHPQPEVPVATPAAPPQRRSSVFVRLVLVMAATAACLLLLVVWFFFLIISPGTMTSIRRMVKDHAAAVAASGPDQQAAQRIADRLDLQIRYSGPAGEWTTSRRLPTFAMARDTRRTREDYGWELHLLPAPDGGSYLFGWSFVRGLHRVHTQLLLLLLFFVLAVVLTAWAILARLLSPLRDLADGVARLGAGELDVELPARRRDELGAVTTAFNAMARRVAAMIRARDRLLVDVSHELRSPLTRLKVALELQPESPRRERMRGDLAEMETMIAELLERERLRDGQSLRAAPTDLVALAREVADGFDDRPPGVRVVAGGPLVAVVDAETVRTVLRNLLDNATKYALPDSRATEVSLVATADGGAEVRVRDDGPGIPPEEVQNLFEPFYRLDRSRSKKTGGYGLGLSICKRVMEAHGGSIAIEPAAGRGATFVLVFPPPRAAAR